MNKNEAKLKIINCFNDEHFVMLDDFLYDINDLLKRHLKGQEKVFFSLLIKNLNHLKEMKKEELTNLKSIEILKHYTEFVCYSIRIKNSSTINIRLLGTFDENMFLFLVAFYEVSGKGKNSYKKYVPIALQRLKEYEKNKEEF